MALHTQNSASDSSPERVDFCHLWGFVTDLDADSLSTASHVSQSPGPSGGQLSPTSFSASSSARGLWGPGPLKTLFSAPRKAPFSSHSNPATAPSPPKVRVRLAIPFTGTGQGPPCPGDDIFSTNMPPVHRKGGPQEGALLIERRLGTDKSRVHNGGLTAQTRVVRGLLWFVSHEGISDT